MWGQRFLGAWIAAILVAGAVLTHTQAPLATRHCPPNEPQAYSQAGQERCAPLDVLFARSANDLQAGIADFIVRNRDEITAVSTLIVAIFTGTLWWVTRNMVRIAQEQRVDLLRSINAAEATVKAMEQANIHSADSLAASERAWLRPTVTVKEAIYMPEHPLDWRVWISFSTVIENLGRSPATHVRLRVKAVFLGAKEVVGWDVSAAQTSLSIEVKERANSGADDTVIFPTATEDRYRGMGISDDELTAAKYGSGQDLLVSVYFLGCIDYRIQFSDGSHQTWFAYQMARRDDGLLSVDYLRAGKMAAEGLQLFDLGTARKFAD